MKIQCDPAALQAAFSAASAVVPKTSPKPILQSVRLRADADGCTLAATNLELSLTARALGVEVLEPGAAMLPTARFAAILRTATAGEPIRLHAKADTNSGLMLAVESGRAKYSLATEAPDLFPEVAAFPDVDPLVVPAADLRRLVGRTIFATDPESTRYALGGMLVEREEDRIVFVGTDGRRLARQSAECRGLDAIGQPVTPIRAWKAALKHLDEKAEPARLAFDRNSMWLDAGTVAIWARLVEGRFPRYQDVFPGDPKGKFAATAGALLQAFRQAEICTSEESRGVDLKLGPACSLAATAAAVGASAVELPFAYEGPPMTVSLDVRYLVDSLSSLDPADSIEAAVIDQKTAIVFRSEDGFTYVIMPLTRDR